MPTLQIEQSEATIVSSELIPHVIENHVIMQRASDGYVHATAMCKANGKLMAEYMRLASTQAFMDELASDMGIPISLLVHVKKGVTFGSTAADQCTWNHPDAAVHFGQWLSPKFAV